MPRNTVYGRRYSDYNASWRLIAYGAVAIIYFVFGFLVGRYFS